ncbi:MAG: ATP-dependent DNA helicase PcrA [Candidatus Portnoybacteria bacterium CG10_big_fil_rev_8_21_14_0_10_44_7]|uniref:DNA 3'-5' helicase n=1 Tax=Candidatus Portnoybacteria bacterium CG10_big_fil_rev_8_21_14_0_10_44_7 TaxID=1974816 RepID=A0A2M8KIG8_9BACT|nr:MAG: ATP-dependent DNA helicase PcrA [Candidatus Portnoybacteria bacterium CG10_big_fil_rev_8_21_14_0_10_44_7]
MPKNPLLQELNQKQQAAVKIISGPVLILAGPGSGKTRVLTHRIAYLLRKNIPAKNILAVTFTNKAAEEMRRRVSRLIAKKSVPLPLVGTFHSICARWLRAEIKRLGYGAGFSIFDTDDTRGLLKKVMRELSISPEQFKVNLVRQVISAAKNELAGPELYESQAFDFFPKTISKIYTRYQQRLREINALDFDDLILLMVKIFQDCPDVLAKYQNRFRYLLIDEYQDTNHAQYVLISLLAKKYRNLFVIGDEAQSIYGFRGADFRNILNFEQDYPEAKIILLEQNYRSTQQILDAAHCVIAPARQKKEKRLWTDNQNGQPLIVFQACSGSEEGEFVISEIKKLQAAEGLTWRDFVVLYRTNAQSRGVEEAFLRAGIPYKIIGGFKFYERKEIKDLLAYLKYLQNKNDFVSLERIINTPPRGIGQNTLQQIQQNGWQLKAAGKSKVAVFAELIEKLAGIAKRQKLSRLIKKISALTGYKEYLLDGTEEGISRWENVLELLSVAQKYDRQKPGRGLELFLEEVSLLTDQDEISDQHNQVNLMTLHCAKGLEFPVVFIIGFEEGLFPHSRSLEEEGQIEEERRLCYVGITRAKSHLYLLYAQQRQLYGGFQANPPSRFLDEISPRLLKKQKSPHLKDNWLLDPDDDWDEDDDEVEEIEWE